MAPEQIKPPEAKLKKGDPKIFKSDVYSLGLTVHQMCTKQIEFLRREGESQYDHMLRKIDESK